MENKIELIRKFVSICLQDKKDVKIIVEKLKDTYRILLNVTIHPNEGMYAKLNKSIDTTKLKDRVCKVFGLKPNEVYMFHIYHDELLDKSLINPG